MFNVINYLEESLADLLKRVSKFCKILTSIFVFGFLMFSMKYKLQKITGYGYINKCTHSQKADHRNSKNIIR